MLTIDNFDSQLDPNTLQNGRSYFKRKAVLYLQSSGQDLWHAEVEGTEVYSVEIRLANRQVVHAFCDCSAQDLFCKHTVAVLLVLREQLKKPAAKTRKNTKKLTIDVLLEKVSDDELRRFVSGYAASDSVFASKIQLHFADKDERIDIGRQYRELVKKAIKSHSNRGFVEYRSTRALAREISQILATGNQFFTRQNYRDALTVGRVVLTAMMTVLDQCDDSSGYLSSTISNAITLLKQVAEADAPAQALREQLFDFLADELHQNRYFGYGDFGHQLLQIAFTVALKLPDSDKFLTLIDQLIPLHQDEYSDYTQSLLRTTQVRFLKTMGRREEARRLTDASLTIVDIRQDAVSETIEALQFDRAKTLLEEGILVARQKKHPGTVRQWQEQLLKIAYLENDVPTIRHWTKTFAFDDGQAFSLPYYRQWKQTFSANEWAIEYESLIRQFAQIAEQNTRQARAVWFFETDSLFHQLGPVYVEEKQWIALLELVSQQPSIERLQFAHPHLAFRFPVEMLALYLPILEKLGKSVHDRADYRQLANLIGLLKRDIPESITVMNALIQQLKERNPRRPAFLEELNSIQ
ncbi:hypothetical protein GCM10027347_47440 [Larkinella harenae]